MTAPATPIPLRARLPWFAIWVPVALLLYTLVNGAGHLLVLSTVLMTEPSREQHFVLQAADVPCSPWGFLLVPVLIVFATVSWKLCPQWSPSIRWLAGMLGLLLCTLFLLTQAAMLCPDGWKNGMPSARDLRTYASWIWKPHFCRPTLESFHSSRLSWKAQTSDIAALLKDPDAMVRGRAGYFLGFESALPHISALLRDTDPRVRGFGIEAVQGYGGGWFIEFIIDWLDHPDHGARTDASAFLESLAGKKFSCDAAGVLAAQAWWDQHKNDPEFAPKR